MQLKKLGPKVNDFNKGDNHGCGYFQVTEKNGLRCSAAVGYLNPIKDRKNLKNRNQMSC